MMATATKIPPQSESLALVERPENHALAVTRPPDVVLKEAHKAARALAKVIEGQPKKIVFNGKTYLTYENWQTIGRFYGVTAVVRTTKYVEYGEGEFKACGFEAQADALLVSTNQVISSAEALCLNDEPKWSLKPLFQLKSMSQTRACAKALRNVLAWVVVLAGYAPTPAEEMGADDTMTGAIPVEAPRRRSAIAANGNLITAQQQKKLFEIAKQAGVPFDEVRAILSRAGFEHSFEITQKAYAEICAQIAR